MQHTSDQNIPIYVDLDGTLIKTNSFLESLLILLKINPCYIFLIFFWLIKGINHLKSEVANRIILDPATLPYSTKLLNYLKNEYSDGRKLVLISTTHKKIAECIANYLGIFTQVIASDDKNNLREKTKYCVINHIASQKAYEYISSKKHDAKILNSARYATVVNLSNKFIHKLQANVTVKKVFWRDKNLFLSILKVIRPYQYVKNLLIFIPLLISYRYLEPESILNATLAFVSFCLLASAVYIINDLFDLEADRKHKSKHKRSLAAGDIPISVAIYIAMLLIAASFLIAQLLNSHFVWILASYFLLSSIYSFYIKQKLLLDVFVLSILYTVRVIAGINAIDSNYSEWLISFSIFFFLSLAFVKRYSELYFAKQDNKLNILGRSYFVKDLHQLSLFGTVSGYVSTLVFAFYVSSSQVVVHYHYPQYLWLVCLLLLYWISHIWMLVTRGLIHEDPIIFALEDKTSLFTAFVIAFIMLYARV